MSYNYDLPSDGTPISCPINMGDGSYTFRVMQNTSGNNYVELLSTSEAVTLATEFEPFLRPSTYCMYTPTSAVVAQAKALAADAANEGDVMRNVYNWVTSNIQYDKSKATQLSNATGYIPNPDQTLAEGTGICFDYASLTAALLRSLGIPCKIVTGYVEPNDIYHAWNMVHLNGTWVGTDIDIKSGTWSRIDLTFAASGENSYTVDDGEAYVDRYIY